MTHSRSTTAHSPPVPVKTPVCPLAPAAHPFTPLIHLAGSPAEPLQSRLSCSL